MEADEGLGVEEALGFGVVDDVIPGLDMGLLVVGLTLQLFSLSLSLRWLL